MGEGCGLSVICASRFERARRPGLGSNCVVRCLSGSFAACCRNIALSGLFGGSEFAEYSEFADGFSRRSASVAPFDSSTPSACGSRGYRGYGDRGAGALCGGVECRGDKKRDCAGGTVSS